jgi:hypothetical protein
MQRMDEITSSSEALERIALPRSPAKNAEDSKIVKIQKIVEWQAACLQAKLNAIMQAIMYTADPHTVVALVRAVRTFGQLLDQASQ